MKKMKKALLVLGCVVVGLLAIPVLGKGIATVAVTVVAAIIINS